MVNSAKIRHSSNGIVVEDTRITLSNEKLTGILLHTYEKAINNATRWRFYNLYKVLLSIAGTLFVTLFTSSFNDIGQINAETIRSIVIFITISCTVSGFIFLGISIYQKKKSDTEERDYAIDEVIGRYFGQ